MEPSQEPGEETRVVPGARIAGFWRRFLAWMIDGAVLFLIVGMPLGLLLGEDLAPVGTPARLLGLLVVVPYFGVFGSRVGDGQTLGKRQLGIRVVDSAGRPLSLARSTFRALVLCLPWFFNGIRFGSPNSAVPLATWAPAILVFGLGGAIVGTLTLNRRTRQGAHDLVVGSYVVVAEDEGRTVSVSSSRAPAIASAAWVGLVTVATTVMMAIFDPRPPPDLADSLAAIPGVSTIEVGYTRSGFWGWRRGRGLGTDTRQSLDVVLWCRGPSADPKHLARQAAAAMLENYPGAATVPQLQVTIVRGWDIGIASGTRRKTFVKPPEQWRAELDL